MKHLNILCCVALAACTPGAQPEEPLPTRIVVEPGTSQLAPGATVNLTATFSPTGTDTRVTWSMLESGSGTVSATGVYQAPAVAGSFHVIATSVALSTVKGQALINVVIPLSVTVTAPTAVACVPTQMSASVTGSATQSVTWSLPDPSCGSISPSGVFASIRGTGTCDVKACSTVDSSVCGTATSAITAEQILGVTVAPNSANVPESHTRAFGATVTTTCGTFPAGG